MALTIDDIIARLEALEKKYNDSHKVKIFFGGGYSKDIRKLIVDFEAIRDDQQVLPTQKANEAIELLEGKLRARARAKYGETYEALEKYKDELNNSKSTDHLFHRELALIVKDGTEYGIWRQVKSPEKKEEKTPEPESRRFGRDSF